MVESEDNMDYLREKTTEQLIELYAFEQGRINDDDKMRTQARIKKELKRRFNVMITLLDDEQTTANPKGTYRRLIEG